MAGWHHGCNKHELGQTLGDGEGQEVLKGYEFSFYISIEIHLIQLSDALFILFSFIL